MAWLVLCSVIIGIAIGYAWGYHERDLHERYNSLKDKLTAMKKPEPTAPTSSILRPPETPQERFQREHEEMLERIAGSPS